MSSDMKDARWGLATSMAENLGLEYEDFNYSGWEKLLGQAQETLDKYPSGIDYWAKVFRGE